MICPECGAETTVADCSRGDHIVVRRRKCLNCGESFYTAERRVDKSKGYKALRDLKERHRRQRMSWSYTPPKE